MASARRPLQPGTLLRVGDRLRFVDADGTPWTIWDCTFSAHHYQRVPHGARRATARVFVNAAGVRRAYGFQAGEDHTVHRDAVARQLLHSTWLPTKPFDPDAHGRGIHMNSTEQVRR